jgi:Domain of unknown function (DUF4276)
VHLELLVEEPSAEAALDILLPSILPEGFTYAIHPHQGKQSLLKNLPSRLAGYDSQSLDDTAICVLVDRDTDNCQTLKQAVIDIAQNATLSVLVRIAIEELEAWFFGDVPAIGRAYPGADHWIRSRHQYRDPDAITGGTAEMLGRALRRAGYHRGGLPKVAAAARIAREMDVDNNSSHSFTIFRDGLRHRLAPAKGA